MTGRMVFAGLLLCGFVGGCGKSDSAPPTAALTEPADTMTADIGGALRSDANPTVSLRTSQGTIKLRLATDKAPLTVDNFLAQVESGFYDQTIFHQVEPGYVVLAGGYRPDLMERKSRYSIPNESRNGLTNRRGTVAMARAPHSTESDTGQFFINLADNPALDRTSDTPDGCGYCVFAEVIEGMDVVERIAQSRTRAVGEFSRLPVETVLLESATKVR